MSDTTDANAYRDSAPTAGSTPFFARFLEGQNRVEQSAQTLKYPSDRDEDIDPILDAPTTDGNILQAAPEKRMTLKYPSDRDEWWDNN
jgi:hypothetical protein